MRQPLPVLLKKAWGYQWHNRQFRMDRWAPNWGLA